MAEQDGVITVYDPRNPIESLIYAITWHMARHHDWPARVEIPGSPGEPLPALGPLVATRAPTKAAPPVQILRSSKGTIVPLEARPEALGIACHPR